MKQLLDFLPDFSRNSTLAESMAHRVAEWCALRTASFDSKGLNAFADALEMAFSPLGASYERIALKPLAWRDDQGALGEKPLGPALRWRQRPEAPVQVLLCIHTDVVYGEGDTGVTGNPAVTVRQEGDWLHASGAADAKGGIAILLESLRCLECSPWKNQLGYEILLNPDEELGSPGSRPLLQEAAGRHDFGLVFEPCLPDGSLVGERKGSGNYTLIMRGVGAHAGRDFERGRNAIVALSQVVCELAQLSDLAQGLTVNVGRMVGGGAVNRVPDLALARVNIRVTGEDQVKRVEAFLQGQIEFWKTQPGFRLELEGGISSPPKPFAGATAELMGHVLECAALLKSPLAVKSSGGVCDGNKLASYGLPNVDTLGAQGDGLHGPQERLYLPSLGERTRLTALLLLSAASGHWKAPKRLRI